MHSSTPCDAAPRVQSVRAPHLGCAQNTPRGARPKRFWREKGVSLTSYKITQGPMLASDRAVLRGGGH